MKKILFKDIPTDAKLLAMGNHFRRSGDRQQWRVAAYFRDHQGKELTRNLAVEALCVMGLGRQFVQLEGEPYRSGGFKQEFSLPPVASWQERCLGDCSRLSKRLAVRREVAEQKCFVFDTGGITVWLPKFELARKLFFHAGFLVRAAYHPSGLDIIFNVKQDDEEAVHIHTPAKTGAPVSTLKKKAYRDLLAWLLLNEDVRQSFDSIWTLLNRDLRERNGYQRWQFDFRPPNTLDGVKVIARGPYDSDDREMLIWEISGLQGLGAGTNEHDIYFHHPSLKLPVRGTGEGRGGSGAQGADDIEVDTEQEPDEAKDRQTIELPMEDIVFSNSATTKLAYNGKKAGILGQEDQGELEGSNNPKVLGIGDDVIGGSIAPGEYQQLEAEERQYSNRFVMLKQIIRQIAGESDGKLSLLELKVQPLPQIPRCSYHKMEDEKLRCYLTARFRLEDGRERYILEVDTSDNKKKMSTRIVGFKSGVEINNRIEKIIKGVVKSSLRWPSSMNRSCEVLYSVHHPKESDDNVHEARMVGWKLRVKSYLI
ncbi:Tn7-like element transposition protein TnsE [Halomonas marinisediminis]|uniref:Transposase n=1 Tax=Halomonas marinisediminis TaxID=2546095 RepID=A0ABY2D464_9GAMM|nr:Tn7-like element transposition protein TnsE [Halomonas marinisediminis]TDB01183.1 transposase [Halomonas marinisediminis]